MVEVGPFRVVGLLLVLFVGVDSLGRSLAHSCQGNSSQPIWAQMSSKHFEARQILWIQIHRLLLTLPHFAKEIIARFKNRKRSDCQPKAGLFGRERPNQNAAEILAQNYSTRIEQLLLLNQLRSAG